MLRFMCDLGNELSAWRAGSASWLRYSLRFFLRSWAVSGGLRCWGGLGVWLGCGWGSLGGGSETFGRACSVVGWGGEGKTGYSSIWLLIEEAGVVSFVLFCVCLPCAGLLLRFGCGCGKGQSAWGAGSAGLLRCPLCLLIECSGGEGGTVCSSIWLFIEEAGVVGFVMFEGGLPCACVQFVCRASCGCGVVMGFAFRREPEYSAMWVVWEGICMVRSLGVCECLPGLHLRFICGFVWGQFV